MPTTPVIDESVSILALAMGQYFVFQPAALNTPTSWAADGLPEGVDIDTSTGKIDGIPTEPGFYNIALRATNAASPPTDEMIFHMGVEAVPYNADGFIELDWDIPTGRVKNPAIPGSDKDGVPVLYGKKGDWLLLSIGNAKGGVLQSLSRSQMGIGIKEYMSERILILSDGVFEASGAFNTSRCKIAVYLDPAKLRPVISNYPSIDDKNNAVDAVMELQMGLQYIKPGESVPSILEVSSGNFIIRIAEDISTDIE